MGQKGDAHSTKTACKRGELCAETSESHETVITLRYDWARYYEKGSVKMHLLCSDSLSRTQREISSLEIARLLPVDIKERWIWRRMVMEERGLAASSSFFFEKPSPGKIDQPRDVLRVELPANEIPVWYRYGNAFVWITNSGS